MSIAKNQVIKKDDIFNYLISKDFEQIDTVTVTGSFWSAHFANKEGYFWLRNDNSLFKTSAYNALVAYALGKMCTYDGEVYESQEDANTGNTPDVSPTKWRLVPNGVVTSSHFNVRFRATIRGSINSSGDMYEYTLWRVTWDSNQDEVLTQVYYGTDDHSDSSIQMSMPAGYYKYKLRVGSQGSSSRTTAYMDVKRYANDIFIGKTIRVFTSDFKSLSSLGATPVTATLAKTGRLTTEDYFGGDYEVHVP